MEPKPVQNKRSILKKIRYDTLLESLCILSTKYEPFWAFIVMNKTIKKITTGIDIYGIKNETLIFADKCGTKLIPP